MPKREWAGERENQQITKSGGKNIFHFPYLIFHFSLQKDCSILREALTELTLSNDKYQMTNGKWKMENGTLRPFRNLLIISLPTDQAGQTEVR